MDYRYYYETVEADRAGRRARMRPLAVLAAGAAIEAVALAVQSPGGAGMACAAAVLAAVGLACPLGRAAARTAARRSTRSTAPA